MTIDAYKDNPLEASSHNDDDFPPMASVFRSNENTITVHETAATTTRRPPSRRRVWMLRMVYLSGLLLLAVIAVAVYVGRRNSEPRNVGPLLSQDEMQQYLRRLVGAEELHRADSYTNQAYRWMLQNPFPTQEYRMRVEDRVLQRYALACLYYATYQVNNDWLRYNRGMINAAPSELFPWLNSRGWMIFSNEW